LTTEKRTLYCDW